MTVTSVHVLCSWPPHRPSLCSADDEWAAAGVTELIVCQVAGPLSIGHKEPVGSAFHLKILQQAGLWGECQKHNCGRATQQFLSFGHARWGRPPARTVPKHSAVDYTSYPLLALAAAAGARASRPCCSAPAYEFC